MCLRCVDAESSNGRQPPFFGTKYKRFAQGVDDGGRILCLAWARTPVVRLWIFLGPKGVLIHIPAGGGLLGLYDAGLRGSALSRLPLGLLALDIFLPGRGICWFCRLLVFLLHLKGELDQVRPAGLRIRPVSCFSDQLINNCFVENLRLILVAVHLQP